MGVRTTPRWILLLAVALVALVAAGCGRESSQANNDAGGGETDIYHMSGENK